MKTFGNIIWIKVAPIFFELKSDVTKVGNRFSGHCLMACKPGFFNSFKFQVSCMVDEIGRLENLRIYTPTQGSLNDGFIFLLGRLWRIDQ